MNEHLDYMAGVVRTMVGIQVRMGSHRRPGKALAEITPGLSVLRFMIERFRHIRTPALIVVLTTELPEDDAIVAATEAAGVVCVRGATVDLLSRWWKAIEITGSDIVVRCGADDPFIDPRTIDLLLGAFDGKRTTSRGWPLGLNADVVPREDVRIAAEEATDPEEREHGEPFWQRRPRRFPAHYVDRPGPSQYHRRLTIDTEPDLALHRRIAAHFAPRVDFSSDEIIALLDANPDWEDETRDIEQWFWDMTPVAE